MPRDGGRGGVEENSTGAQRLGIDPGSMLMVGALRVRRGTSWQAWRYGRVYLDAGRLTWVGRLSGWRKSTTDLTGIVVMDQRTPTAYERWKWSSPFQFRTVLECEHPELGTIEIATEALNAEIVASVFIKQLPSRSNEGAAPGERGVGNGSDDAVAE